MFNIKYITTKLDFAVQKKLQYVIASFALSWFYAICSQIIIPLPFNFVPMSLQPAPLFLATLLFGKQAINAYFVYLIQGGLGLPFFSGMLGGIGRLLGPTGGYLFGFGIAMIFINMIQKTLRGSRTLLFASLIIAEILVFMFGLMQLSFFVPINKVLAAGLFPFIIGDFVIKPILVIFCFLQIHKVIKHK